MNLAEKIYTAATEQSIGFDPKLLGVLGRPDSYSCEFGDDLVVRDIGRALMARPDYRVSQRPLGGTALTDTVREQTVRRIINSPHRPLPAKIIRFSCTFGASFVCCERAEEGFELVLNALTDQDAPNHGYELFTDDEGAPIFVRKAYNGVASALSFEQFAVRNVIFPPGSIVRIDTFDDIERGFVAAPYEQRITHSVRDIAGISFMRDTQFSDANTGLGQLLAQTRNSLIEPAFA